MADVRTQLTGAVHREQFVQLLLEAVRKLAAIGAPHEADDIDVFDQHNVGRRLRHPPAGETDNDDPALEIDRPEGNIEHIAADRIENDVGATLPARLGDVFDPRANILGRVVDQMIGAMVRGDRQSNGMATGIRAAALASATAISA